MLIKNWIAVRKQNFSKPGPNEDTLESDMLIDEMFIINEMVGHSSEISCLCLMKCPYSFFRLSFRATLFFRKECPCLCRHRLGHSLGKNKVVRNGKSNFGFSYIQTGTEK